MLSGPNLAVNFDHTALESSSQFVTVDWSMLVEPSRSVGPHKVPTEPSQSESDVKGSPCMRCAPQHSADLTATSLSAHLWIEAFRHARVVGRRDGKEERCHSSLRNNPRGERDACAPHDVDRTESTASQSVSPENANW
jgi:hypothetical protein